MRANTFGFQSFGTCSCLYRDGTGKMKKKMRLKIYTDVGLLF